MLQHLSVSIDPVTGAIASGTTIGSLALSADGASVFVSDEGGGPWGYTVSGDIVPDTVASIYAGVSGPARGTRCRASSSCPPCSRGCTDGRMLARS